MGLYKKEQYFMVVAEVLFLIGAVFMLVYTFGNQVWALWVGLGFAVAAVLLYILIQFQHLQFNKKYTAKKRELKDAAEKEAAPVIVPAVEKPAPVAGEKKPVSVAEKPAPAASSKSAPVKSAAAAGKNTKKKS